MSVTGIIVGIRLNKKINQVMSIANENFNRIDDSAKKFGDLTYEANKVMLARVQKLDQELGKVRQQVQQIRLKK
jgi:hypothetical protein